jgi:Putative adhesin
MIRKLFPFITFLWLVSGGLLFAESTATFKRSVPLAPADHLILDVTVPEGTVNIHYAHSGEISVAATAKMDEGEIAADFFDKSMTVVREGNHLRVQYAPDTRDLKHKARITFNIDVPYWLEVNSTIVGTGKQSVLGVQGPVKLVSGSGDIEAEYITTNLDATTGKGNIKVIRVGMAAKLETGSGNINLKDIGPTVATVRKGTGRLEMDGVSGSFTGKTDAGELIAKGQVFDGWDLNSTSGEIYVQISQEHHRGYEMDASTRTGRISVESDDLEVSDKDARECHQKVYGGGGLVHVRSGSGNILLHSED